MTIVTVLVNGTFVYGSQPATLRDGVVVVPVVPYVARLAERVQRTRDGFVFERAGRSVRVAVGSRLARSASDDLPLPIAPYLRAGITIIPLAAVARALGADATYDAPSHTLQLELPALPLATMTPIPVPLPAASPGPTFAPTSTPAPAVTVTGIPMPRRTPISIQRRER